MITSVSPSLIVTQSFPVSNPAFPIGPDSILRVMRIEGSGFELSAGAL
jgi:hypothetical protein